MWSQANTVTKVHSAPTISVVVPTRNSERTLERCLQSIRGQTVACELVVVDNESRDRTVAIANRLADIVLVEGPERSAQRNAGLKATSGEYVGFIDSDMELEPNVAQEAAELLKRGAGGVTVPEYTAGSGFWVAVREWERHFYLGEDTVEAARFFRRDVLDEIGGFDEDMPPGPEDWDLTIRVRSKQIVARTAARIRHNEGTVTYIEACRKKAYYAPGLRHFQLKHGNAQLLTALSRVYLRHPWKLIYPHPLLGLGVVALKSGEAAAVAGALIRRARQTS